VGTKFSALPDRPWGAHPASCKNGYRVFHRGEVRPERAADHSPLSSAAVMQEYRYTSTHPLSHTGPVTGSLYLFYLLLIQIYFSYSNLRWYFELHNLASQKRVNYCSKIMYYIFFPVQKVKCTILKRDAPQYASP